MTPTDHDLVQRVLLGEGQALEALFERYAPVVLVHLSQMLRDRSAAEDLLQEAFLRVWTRAGQWEGRGLFRAWLMRLATNLALNHIRSVRRRREQPLETLPGILDEDEENPAPSWMIDVSSLGPDAVVEQADQRRLIRGLVDTLPEDKRGVFWMVHDAEMEVREVAERLGIPEGMVKSRLHHARKRIARDWRELETQEEDIPCR